MPPSASLRRIVVLAFRGGSTVLVGDRAPPEDRNDFRRPSAVDRLWIDVRLQNGTDVLPAGAEVKDILEGRTDRQIGRP